MRPATSILALMLASGPAALAITSEELSDLVEKLQDSPGFKVRLQAAMILGRTAGAQAFDPLVKALDGDPHYTVRGAAALALGTVGDPKAVEFLVQSIDSDPEGFVRAQAESALIEIAAKAQGPAVPYMVAALDRALLGGRLALVRALVRVGDPPSLRALAESLADEDPAVRSIATGALEKAPAAAVGDALIACLSHSNFKVRAAAARDLTRLKETRALERLAELAVDQIEVPEVQEAARGALVAMKDRLDVETLIRASQEAPDKRERARAVALLGAVGSEQAFIAAMASLADKDVYVRGIAATVLANLEDPRALPALERLLDDQQANARIVRLVKSAIARIARKAGKP